MRIKRDYTNIEGYIYKIESPSGKIYIGQTINLKQRKWYYSNLKCKTQPILYRSLLKYGWDAHKFEIIEKYILNIDRKILNEREVYWIKEYNCFNNGLNCNIGGDGNIGYKMSDETKEKLRNANLGKKQTPEAKAKQILAQKHIIRSKEWSKNISKALKGKKKSEETKNKIRGYKHTDEAKNKMSIAKKGKQTRLGSSVSKETRKKISETIKRKIKDGMKIFNR